MRDLREVQGITRDELLAFTGLSGSRLREVETRSRADDATVDVLLHALGTTWEALATRGLVRPELFEGSILDTRPDLPDRVRRRRFGLGLSQQEVAARAGLPYVTAVSQLETGKRVRNDYVVRILRVLSIDPAPSDP